MLEQVVALCPSLASSPHELPLAAREVGCEPFSDERRWLFDSAMTPLTQYAAVLEVGASSDALAEFFNTSRHLCAK